MIEQDISFEIWNEFEQELLKTEKASIEFKANLTPIQTNGLNKFWEIFLNEKLPEGSINKTLEKNFAVYIIRNRLNLEEIKEKYKTQKWNIRALLGWIKKVNLGEITEFNIPELVNWCKQYKPEMLSYLQEPIISPIKKEFEVLWDKDLSNYEAKEIDWIIKSLIPARSVGVWTGKRGTMKTFLVLSAIYKLAQGGDFLERYPTKKCKILYLDKENGTPIIINRCGMIKNGMGVTENLEIGFICFSALKIDNPSDIQKIEEIIQKEQIGLLVVDTYRRGISFDENSAGDVSHLFVDVLRPLVERNELTIILIHHDRKGQGQGDEMDEIRGSSDLANYTDFILKNERKGKNKIILKQLKCRSAPEIAPIEVCVDTDENTYITFNSLGTYEPQTEDTKASEMIIIWIKENNKKEFRTGEVMPYCINRGIKKTNFYAGLSNLQSFGQIKQISKGLYKVENEAS